MHALLVLHSHAFITPLATPCRQSATLPQLAMSESLAVTTSKAVAGLAVQPVAWSSLYTVTTTSCGLRGEAGGTAEGVAYAAVAVIAISSLYTRAATGSGLAAAELEAAELEYGQLKAVKASEVRLRFSEEKTTILRDGPLPTLLTVAELLCLMTTAVTIAVFGALALKGSLPSAVPVVGGACWG